MNPMLSSELPSYRVNLDVFEGPLDLLLYLIKKNDLNIYDIPIARIAEEYLNHLDSMHLLNIDLAGEFVLMASELAHIKSRMLLPSLPAEEGVDEIDPRADLVRRLLEYQRYKVAAFDLDARSQLNRDMFMPLSPEVIPSAAAGEIAGNVYHLIEAFQKLLKKIPEETVHAVTVDRLSINERIFQILNMLKLNETVSVDRLLPMPLERYTVVITFLSLLEMVRLNMIQLFQGGLFETLYVTKVVEELATGEALSLIQEE